MEIFLWSIVIELFKIETSETNLTFNWLSVTDETTPEYEKYLKVKFTLDLL